MRDEIQDARNLMPGVRLTPEAERAGLELVHRMGVDSLRAEITMFEAARAFAAADLRTEVTPGDVRAVAPMALRLRRSQFMADYFSGQQVEESEIRTVLDELVPPAEVVSRESEVGPSEARR
jgi:magnesium chelatase subunit I